MASDRQLEIRVSRLENDTASIYDILGQLASTQQEHTRRFDGIDQRLDGIDQRFDGIDQRLDGMDQRFDGMDQRFDGMDQRFDGIESTLAEVIRRLPEPS